MYKRNRAVTGFAFGLVNRTDGTDITTGTVTGTVTIDGGAQTALTNAPAHEGGGEWSVNLTAAEMDGKTIKLKFSHASAITQHFTIVTTQADHDDAAALGLTRLDQAVGTRSSHSAADVWAAGTRTLTSGANIALAKGTGVTGFNDLSAAQVNAEVDTALVDARLDELLAADSDIDGAAPPAVGSVFFELLSKTVGSFTFDQATDSLEAIRDRGDAAWITATGFSTHSAADVWAVATRTLTGFAFTVTVGSLAADTVTAAALAADAVAEIQAGLATAAALATVDDFLDTEVAAIKAVTDRLDTALELDGAVYRYTVNALENAPVGGGGGVADWTAGEREQIRHRLGIDGTAAAPAATPSLATAAALATVDDFLDTEIAAILAAVDTEVAAVKAKTDNLPADPASNTQVATRSSHTAADAAATVGALIVEGTITLLMSLRGINAATMGKASGLGTTTAVYRDLADTKARLTATVDSDGNRTAITRDLT